MSGFLFAAPPQPTLQFYNHYITLDLMEMINCSVTAFPQPQFQWKKQSTEEILPESSWVSVNHGRIAHSTLMYTFGTSDFNDSCTTVVVCRATNVYGTNEELFTLNSCSPPSSVYTTHTLLATSNDSTNIKNEEINQDRVVPILSAAATILMAVIIVVLLPLIIIVVKRKKR